MSLSLWANNLAAYALQITLLVIAGALLPLIFRLRVPGAKLLYWQLLLAGCLLMPAVQPWKVSVEDSSVRISQQAVLLDDTAHRNSPRIPLTETIVTVLGAGVAARLAWLMLGFWRLRRYRGHSSLLWPVPAAVADMQRRIGVYPEVYISQDIPGPVTFGIRRPIILLPTRFLDLELPVQEAIACHELLHVRRRDWIFTVFEEAVRSVLWFHPAVWWLLGQIQLTREQTVDREVVDCTQSRDRYVDALLAIAATKAGPDLAPAPLFLQKRHLTQRVALILKEVSMSKHRLIFSLVTIIGLLLAAGRLAVWSFPLQAPEAPGVTVETGNYKLLHRPRTEFPREAKEKRVEGAVVVEISVNEKGLVTDARVLSGPEELRRAALESVLQWHYAADNALPAKIQVTINFQLSGTAESLQPRTFPGIPAGNLGTLKRIDLSSLSPATRDAISSRITIREGDPLTGEVLDGLRQIVSDVDEHLGVSVFRGPTDNTTTIRIALPERGTGFGLQGPSLFTRKIDPESASTGERSTSSPRIKVGGNVQQTKLIQQPKPVYPALAKKARIQGTVRMTAVIGKDGSVQSLELESGHPLLAEAAMDAVKNWVYQTTLLNGNPVEVQTTIDVNFTLSQ
jgi:TonB family protein